MFYKQILTNIKLYVLSPDVLALENYIRVNLYSDIGSHAFEDVFVHQLEEWIGK